MTVGNDKVAGGPLGLSIIAGPRVADKSAGSSYDLDAFMATTTYGDYWDFTDASNLYQDVAKTTPVASEGDLIGNAVGGYRGTELEQGTTGLKPYWKKESGTKMGASLYSLPDTNLKWLVKDRTVASVDMGNKATIAFGFYDKSQGPATGYGSFATIFESARNTTNNTLRIIHLSNAGSHKGYVTANTGASTYQDETYADHIVYYNGTQCEFLVDGVNQGSPNVVTTTIHNHPYLGYLNNASAYQTPAVVQRAIYFDLSWDELSAEDQAGIRAWLQGVA